VHLSPRRSPRFRALAALFLSLLAATALAACGDDGAQSLTFELSGGGAITGPQSADTGEAEITLENNGKEDGELQLIRVEGDHTAEEVVQGLGNAMKGQPFPDWFFAGGGVSSTAGGESKTVTQVLEPGTYYAFNTEGSLPDAKSVPALEVSGEATDEELGGDATVQAFEYGFNAEALPSGKTEITFENSGAQPHHLIASPAIGDATAKEVETFFKEEKGKPPLQEKGTQGTAVIEGGETQLVTFDLEPGRYILYCFISDRQGGPPHALKGMVDEVDVE
jgi:plastocyanin